jgi:hypothetical protein
MEVSITPPMWLPHLHACPVVNNEWLMFIANKLIKCCMMRASDSGTIGFESQSGQTNDHTIGMCCFSVKHAALGRKSKDSLARN